MTTHGTISKWRFDNCGNTQVAPSEPKPKTNFRRQRTSEPAYALVCPHCHLRLYGGECFECGYKADETTPMMKLVTEPNVKFKSINRFEFENTQIKVETILATKKTYVYELVEGIDNKKHWSIVQDLNKLVKILKYIKE